MIPGNIDLTENRDFGDVNHIAFDFAIRQNSPMTNAEYEKIRRHEELFGSNEMYSSYTFIFGIKKHHTCLRCGKPLSIPWRKSIWSVTIATHN